jgi:hypothetical protein
MPILRLVGFYCLSDEIPVVNCCAELIFLVESNNFYFLLLFESTVRLPLISGYIVFLLSFLSVYGLEDDILREFKFGL